MRQQLSTEQFTADVVTLTKIIKRAFNSFQTLAANASEPLEINKVLIKVSEQSKYLLELLRKYKELDFTSYLIVFEKLKQKIKESLTMTKSKWQLINGFKDIRSFIHQMQLALKIFDKTDNFNQFLSKIYTTINEQLRIFKIKLDIVKQDANSNSSYNLRRVLSFPQKIQKNKVNEFRLINLTRLYQLQLDTQHIRSTLTNAQKNKIDVIQSQLDRNKQAQKTIDQYSKRYFLYEQKRKKKNFTSQLCPKIENKPRIRVKTTVHEKLYQNVRADRSRREFIKDKQNQENSSRKALFKLNNLYVSGNQFNMYCGQSRYRWVKPDCVKKKGSVLLYPAYRDALAHKYGRQHSKEFISFIK